MANSYGGGGRGGRVEPCLSVRCEISHSVSVVHRRVRVLMYKLVFVHVCWRSVLAGTPTSFPDILTHFRLIVGAKRWGSDNVLLCPPLFRQKNKSLPQGSLNKLVPLCSERFARVDVHDDVSDVTETGKTPGGDLGVTRRQPRLFNHSVRTERCCLSRVC